MKDKPMDLETFIEALRAAYDPAADPHPNIYVQLTDDEVVKVVDVVIDEDRDIRLLISP